MELAMTPNADTLFNDSVESQGFLVLSAMQFVHSRHTPPELVGSPQLWLATPFALNASRAQTDVERTRMIVQTLLRYVAEAAADDEGNE